MKCFMVMSLLGSDEKDAKNVMKLSIKKFVFLVMLIVVILMNLCLDYYKKNPKKRINNFNKVKSEKFFKDFGF